MLKEFITQPYAEPTSFEEYARLMVKAFDSCVDFLRDSTRFPNREINLAVTLMWQLIGNKEIPIILDQWGYPSLAFVVLSKNNLEQHASLIMPTDFLEQVKEDPVFQLGVIAYMASQCRDFYCGKIRRNNSDEVNSRAQAFEAEALLTLQKMAENEGVTINFHPPQLTYLEKYPKGLSDLPPNMIFTTPIYQSSTNI